MFLKEVFKKGSIDSLDHETLFTIQKFFENNLNVSETSRKLFVHRNTLVYRLEKIKKLTGLDLREFDHAIVFKVALMVKRYLTANPVKYYFCHKDRLGKISRVCFFGLYFKRKYNFLFFVCNLSLERKTKQSKTLSNVSQKSKLFFKLESEYEQSVARKNKMYYNCEC